MSVKGQSIAALLSPTFGEAPTLDKDRAIAVLMSGGVDSSVTAVLLRDAGWDVVGITMKIPLVDACSVRRPCCGTDAALVCKDLGVPHYFVDTVEAFRVFIVEPFRKAYCEGRTPSPCVDCNTLMKFHLVWDLLRDRLGILHLATGHYARIDRATDEMPPRLRRAKDTDRDQSYFLYGAPREHLAFLHFPLGELTKTEVRQLASSRGIFVAAKPDSMELCFAAQGDYRELLRDAPSQHGAIRDTSGNVLGEHEGIHNFTVGQRQGLGVSSSQRLYVTKLVPEDHMVVVGPREAGYETRVRVGEVNVLQPEKLCPGMRLMGKVRSVGSPEPCIVTDVSDDTKVGSSSRSTSVAEDGTPANLRLEVDFDPPVFAPAPGQHLVLYDADDAVVAGGVITR
jgi:tRNA-specific 2-thiouridylase